jgi:metallo-beta-lactamase family protein
MEGATDVKIHGESVIVRAKVRSIEAYSAHADMEGLVKWVKPMRDTLKKVFIVQGEEEAALHLASVIKDRLTVDAVVPDYGQEFEL